MTQMTEEQMDMALELVALWTISALQHLAALGLCEGGYVTTDAGEARAAAIRATGFKPPEWAVRSVLAGLVKSPDQVDPLWTLLKRFCIDEWATELPSMKEHDMEGDRHAE